MGAPEQPHLPGMGDEPAEPVAAQGPDEVADEVADGVVQDDGPGDERPADGLPDDEPSDVEPSGDELPGDETVVAEPAGGAVVEADVSAEQDEEPAGEAAAEPVADETPVDDPVDDEPAAAGPVGDPVGEQAEPVDVVEHDEPDTDEIPLAAASVPAVPAEPEPEPEPPSEPVDETPAAPAPPSGRSVPLHRPRERARTRLLEAMRPKLSRGQVLAALLCAGLGFGLVTQIQSTQSEQLDALTQSDLVRLLQEVNTQADKLADQEARARDERERLVAGQTGDLEADALTNKRLQALGVLAGTLPATGPGIRLTLTDPKGEVDAATLLDTLQEVRDAGAEAVQINDVRIVASTSFQDLDGGVKIGGTPVRPPYVYLVIGDAETLDAAMRIPGGVLDVVEQKGGTGQVDRLAKVDVTALHRVDDPQYARPAPEASP